MTAGCPSCALTTSTARGATRRYPGLHSASPIWDDPRSWDSTSALAAIERLCRTGSVDVPIYDIAQDGVVGQRRLDAQGAQAVVGEGIFAATLIGSCRDHGLLLSAMCIRHHRAVTFLRRLIRDLRERRKPPLVLLRRGLTLLRSEPRLVRTAVASGCELVSARQALERLRGLGGSADGRRGLA